MCSAYSAVVTVVVASVIVETAVVVAVVVVAAVVVWVFVGVNGAAGVVQWGRMEGVVVPVVG